MLALRSSLLVRHGFRHGFSLRTGGVSAGPYASLNLGRNVGDDPAAVAENQRRFADDVGYEQLYEVRQVHGASVERAAAALDPALLRERPADALISADCAIGVKTADCVAVLLADTERGVVAAAHAGWRGVVAHTLAATVAALADAFASTPASLLAAVFPCIGPDAFEVGPEVAEQLAAAVQTRAILRTDTPRPHVDLQRAVQLQLGQLGLAAAHIDVVAGCTFADSARFFSHRRDHGVTGRHLAAIVARC